MSAVYWELQHGPGPYTGGRLPFSCAIRSAVCSELTGFSAEKPGEVDARGQAEQGVLHAPVLSAPWEGDGG